MEQLQKWNVKKLVLVILRGVRLTTNKYTPGCLQGSGCNCMKTNDTTTHTALPIGHLVLPLSPSTEGCKLLVKRKDKHNP